MKIIKDYCVVRDGRAFCGTKSEILHQLCKWWIDEKRTCHYKFNGYKEYTSHTYSAEYTTDEIEAHVVKYLFSEIPDCVVYDRTI